MAEHDSPDCALCGISACEEAPGTKTPPRFCPMVQEPELLGEVRAEYLENPDLRAMAVESARTEAAGYCRSTRVEEIMDFARRMGWRHLGIAHCAGLRQEAKVAKEIFETGGFKVSTVCCKVGSISKEDVGLDDTEKVRAGQFEPLCSPVGQAALLAKAGTELNVLVGLCVGHDSMFFKYSEAPVTVLVAKDRVLGHNPVAALYTSHSYYRQLREGAQPLSGLGQRALFVVVAAEGAFRASSAMVMPLKSSSNISAALLHTGLVGQVPARSQPSASRQGRGISSPSTASRTSAIVMVSAGLDRLKPPILPRWLEISPAARKVIMSCCTYAGVMSSERAISNLVMGRWSGCSASFAIIRMA
jgi:uncharacterized metal-binding protein